MEVRDWIALGALVLQVVVLLILSGQWKGQQMHTLSGLAARCDELSARIAKCEGAHQSATGKLDLRLEEQIQECRKRKHDLANTLQQLLVWQAVVDTRLEIGGRNDRAGHSGRDPRA